MVSKIVSEVIMVLVVVALSVLAFVWGAPLFTQYLSVDNSQARFLESFDIIHGDFPQPGLGEIVPITGSGPPPGSYGTVCTSSIVNASSGGVLVPKNAICKVSANVTGGIYVQQGGTLFVQGATVTGGIKANYSTTVSVFNTMVSGDMIMFKVQSVTISASTIAGNLEVRGARNVSVTGNQINGTAFIQGNHVVTVTNNQVGGTLTFEENGPTLVVRNRIGGSLTFEGTGWCSAFGNTVIGNTLGPCIPKILFDVLNSGKIPVRIVTLYESGQPTLALNWSLASGSSTQCGGRVQPGPCTLLPIVIPVGEIARISLVTSLLGPGDLNSQSLHVLMVSPYNNFVEGRMYFPDGLLMSSHSRPMPRICPCP